MTSSSNRVEIKFHSNSARNYAGFKIKYESIEGKHVSLTQLCGITPGTVLFSNIDMKLYNIYKKHKCNSYTLTLFG